MKTVSTEALGGALSAGDDSLNCSAAKQNTPRPCDAPAQAGWSVWKIKAQLRERGINSVQIAAVSGLSHQGIRMTIRGLRCGIATRQAIAQALGVEVTTIWPDALLPLRERRRMRAAS